MSNRASKTAKRKQKLKGRADHAARVEMYDFTCEHCAYVNTRPPGHKSCNCCHRCAWSKHVKWASCCGGHPANAGAGHHSPHPCDGMMRPFVVRDYALVPGGPKEDAWYWICEGCGLSTQKLDTGEYTPIYQDGEEFIYHAPGVVLMDAEQFPAEVAA